MVVVSFWTRVGLISAAGLHVHVLRGLLRRARLLVLERSFLASIEATALSLLLAYPIAYFLAFKVSPARGAHRPAAVHRAIPGQLHHPRLRLDLAARPHRSDQQRCSWPRG